jgi:putative copper export protein
VTVAFFIAATLVTVLQFIRVRERRLLPLMALFALAAAGHAADDLQWAKWLHILSSASGLALVVMLAPRQTPPRR